MAEPHTGLECGPQVSISLSSSESQGSKAQCLKSEFIMIESQNAAAPILGTNHPTVRCFLLVLDFFPPALLGPSRDILR